MPDTNPSTLFTQTWTDETPLDQIPEEHRAAVEEQRKKAAEDAARAPEARDPVEPLAEEPAPGAGARTRARVAASAAAAGKAPRQGRTGARRRKTAEVAPASEEERVAVVMKTSRFTGRHGRAVPRRTTALVTVERGLKLIVNGDAREATPEETRAAQSAASPVYID